MSNSFYNYSGNFIAGTLARAEAVSAEFSAVAQGFARLSTQGVDTGTVNHVIFSTTGYPVAAYNDGNNLQFKVLFTNTGPTDINVNSIGAVPLLRFNGTPLVAGDLSAGSWYIAIYEAAFGGFTILSPAAYSTFAGSISLAAPSHKVGLVAAAGASTAAAPIDVTFAIDQAIAPTWTGLHTFNNKVVVGAPASGVALQVTGVAGASAAQFLTTGVQVGSPTGGDQGAGTVNVSGNFYVNGAVVSGAVGANPSASVGLAAVNGAASTFLRSDGAPALSQAIIPTWSAQHIFAKARSTAGSSGDYPILLSSTSPAIGLVNTSGAVDATTWEIRTAATTIAITTVNDAGNTLKTALGVTRSGNVVTAMQYGNVTDQTGLDHQIFGSVRVGAVSAVGGNGNLNAAALYQAGQQMFITGTFTATLTGMTAGTTVTATFTISGNIVTLSIPSVTGTSNTTALTITGLPAAIQPATLASFLPVTVVDNGTTVVGGASVAAGSGTLTLYRDVLATGVLSASGFTSSGSKGTTSFSITYSIQ